MTPEDESAQRSAGSEPPIEPGGGTEHTDAPPGEKAVETGSEPGGENGGESLARDLPDEVLSFLVRNAPTRPVWKWLGETPRLQSELTRGFQSTANSLRQPVVRNRFVQHLRNEPRSFDKLLGFWAATSPPPHVVTDVAQLDDEALRAALVRLWKQHGAEALLLALLHAERETALEAYTSLEPESFDDDSVDATAPESAQGSTQPAAPAGAQATSPTLQQTEADLARSRSEIERLKSRLEPMKADLARTRIAHQAEVRELKRLSRQEEHRRSAAERELAEARRTLDRTSRRQRQTERELEETAAENKRLKRQLRQSQQLHEELRKQNAALAARIPRPQVPEVPAEAPSEPATNAAPTPPARTVSPLDQQFVWKSDGRQFRVTPREVQRAIDNNDEEFVFTLIQAFERLREMNEQGYQLFIERVRALGRYYVRVLTADTTRVLIDASNVARYEKDRFGRGQLRSLIAMRNELRLRDCFPILIYADASLIHNIDEPGELAAMARRGELEIVPAGTEADEILAREARRSGAYVVTNDRNFFTKVTPDFEPPRISFRILDGQLVVDEF